MGASCAWAGCSADAEGIGYRAPLPTRRGHSVPAGQVAACSALWRQPSAFANVPRRSPLFFSFPLFPLAQPFRVFVDANWERAPKCLHSEIYCTSQDMQGAGGLDAQEVEAEGGGTSTAREPTAAECGQKRPRPEGDADAEGGERAAVRPCIENWPDVAAQGGAHGPGMAVSTALRSVANRRPLSLPCARNNSFVVRASGHASAVLHGLHTLYDDDSLCDVTVRVDGEDFRAHRVVLAASSDFLRCGACSWLCATLVVFLCPCRVCCART